MSNFLSRTSFGLEGQIRTFKKKGQSLQFAIFPIVGAAIPEYYEQIKNELEKYDLIYLSGSKSRYSWPQRFAYKILTLRPDLGLVTARKIIDIQRLKARIIYADQKSEAFNKSWLKLSWVLRFLFILAMPIYGIYLFLTFNREKLAKFYEPSNLPATDGHWDNDNDEEGFLDGHTSRRKKYTIDKFKEFFNEHRESDLKIAIIAGSSRAELISDYLCRNEGFHVASAIGVTIIEY